MVRTSLFDRKKFVDNIKLQLELNNYGFKFEKNSYNTTGFSIDQARNMNAITELLNLLNNWILHPSNIDGTILFPEAKRKIKYTLNPNNINLCHINLLVDA